VSLSECAAAFLETLSGPNQDKTALERKEKLQNFCNQIEALPYQMVVMAPEAARFMAARCDLPAQSVPAEALALTCGVDVQKYGFYFVVRAWARDFTSWLIHYGMAGTWEDIEQILFAAEYPVVKSSPAPLCEREEENNSGRAGINPAPTDGAAKTLRIWRAAVDTGGGDREFTDQTMTEETYFWLRKNAVGRGCRIWGTKGASWDQAHKVKLSKMMDKTPSGKPLPGGLQILTLDTEKFKDAFFWRLDQALIHGEMAAYLHRDTGPDYFSHITAEQKEADAKGVLRWVKKRARNDWLDCECLAAACADPEWPGGGVNLIAPAAARKIHPPEKREDEVAAGRRRPGWFHRR
jgi:phage terminase large subunit GpA-like protein